jgi:hypothetical protein
VKTFHQADQVASKLAADQQSRAAPSRLFRSLTGACCMTCGILGFTPSPFVVRILWLFLRSPIRLAAWIAGGTLALGSSVFPLRLWHLLLTRRGCGRGLWPLLFDRQF